MDYDAVNDVKSRRKCIYRPVGGNEETKRFPENLGFVAGSEVKVISSNEGNIIAQIKESRVAVSKGIANKIMV
mgnify:CR=1 FL=1